MHFLQTARPAFSHLVILASLAALPSPAFAQLEGPTRFERRLARTDSTTQAVPATLFQLDSCSFALEFYTLSDYVSGRRLLYAGEWSALQRLRMTTPWWGDPDEHKPFETIEAEIARRGLDPDTTTILVGFEYAFARGDSFALRRLVEADSIPWRETGDDGFSRSESFSPTIIEKLEMNPEETLANLRPKDFTRFEYGETLWMLGEDDTVYARRLEEAPAWFALQRTETESTFACALHRASDPVTLDDAVRADSIAAWIEGEGRLPIEPRLWPGETTPVRPERERGVSAFRFVLVVLALGIAAWIAMTRRTA